MACLVSTHTTTTKRWLILFLHAFRVPSDSSDEDLTSFGWNFGNSLLAGYTDHYMSDFVLHGTSDAYPRLLTKLQTDLSVSLQVSSSGILSDGLQPIL